MQRNLSERLPVFPIPLTKTILMWLAYLSILLNTSIGAPFEMASMCVEIQTTRAIAPQILRHRSFSFQEFSQRYAVATETGDATCFAGKI